MTDNSDALRRARRKDSTTKRRRAAEVLQAMIERPANPSPSRPSPAEPACRSPSSMPIQELAGRLADGPRPSTRGRTRDRAWRLPTRSLVTEQSLQADLANAKDHVRRLTEELSGAA